MSAASKACQQLVKHVKLIASLAHLRDLRADYQLTEIDDIGLESEGAPGPGAVEIKPNCLRFARLRLGILGESAIRGAQLQACRRQYLYCCTSKASKLIRGAQLEAFLRQYLYCCTSNASKLST
jgi:hypothetical protein